MTELAGLHPETVAIAAGRPARRPGAPLNQPIVPASTYHHGAEPSYARSGTPTWAALEEAVGALEGGEAIAFGSGLAASQAILDVLAPTAIVAPTSAYFGVAEQLRALEARGLDVRRGDLSPAHVAAAGRGAQVVWAESPSNPLIDVVDLAAAARGAHAAGARLVVDGTFAPPPLQRALDLGAHIVLHSGTKLIGGHSDLLIGLVVTRDEALASSLRDRRELTGGVPGALEAFLALRGLRTLGVRIERAQATAGELALRLAAHPRVARVRYPGLDSHPGRAIAARQMTGFGTMLSFETHGTGEEAEAVCEAFALIVHATSLGGVETTAERRARYAAERLAGTPRTLIRMSVGLEHVDDLWADLEAAL